MTSCELLYCNRSKPKGGTRDSTVVSAESTVTYAGSGREPEARLLWSDVVLSVVAANLMGRRSMDLWDELYRRGIHGRDWGDINSIDEQCRLKMKVWLSEESELQVDEHGEEASWLYTSSGLVDWPYNQQNAG